MNKKATSAPTGANQLTLQISLPVNPQFIFTIGNVHVACFVYKHVGHCPELFIRVVSFY